MSKSVTIPTYMQPDFVCTINNTTYRYKAGTTQTVPDEVAELIENINAAIPQEDPNAGRSFEDKVHDIVDPMVAPMIVHLVYDSEESNYTADKTSAEILDVLESGRRVIIEFGIPTYEGWVYRAEITVSGVGVVDGTRYAGLYSQMVNPLTSELVTVFQDPSVGGDANTTWAMESYTL